MITEVFEKIRTELSENLRKMNAGKQEVVLGPKVNGQKGQIVRIQLFRFGTDQYAKNYPNSSAPRKLIFSFSFFITVEVESYTEQLSLLEHVFEHFETKPFITVQIGGRELEMALSAFELPIEEFNRFWLAQQTFHQPIVFFQARLAEI